MATSNKYDRQLRLWGANGQKSLSECTVILIGSSSAGTESLKNLVLPGIGSFHIIDDAVVKRGAKDDFFCNFFGGFNEGATGEHAPPLNNDGATNDGTTLVTSSTHDTRTEMSRAELTTHSLSALNPDVQSSFTHLPSLLDANYSTLFSEIQQLHFNKYGTKTLMVIAADLPPPILRPIASICWDYSSKNNNNSTSTSTNSTSSGPIPLVIVKSYGLIGSVRIQIPHHAIIESKPDNSVPDLRLAYPRDTFEELHALANPIQLEKLDDQAHGHVPYVLVLLKALDKWRSNNHDTNEKERLPKTMQEKNSFRDTIKNMSRNYHMEMNFQEAFQNAYLAYAKNELPYNVTQVLTTSSSSFHKSVKEQKPVSSFDVLATALQSYLEKNGNIPPLNGSIPDMASSTESFIQLQKIYKTKADHDKQVLRDIISNLQSTHSCAEKYKVSEVTDEQLSLFCKNVYNLTLLQTRSYADELSSTYSNSEEKEEVLGDLTMVTYDPYEVPEHTPLVWYIALRACDEFYDTYGVYPGKDSRELSLESDATTLQTIISKITTELGLVENEMMQSALLTDKKVAKEMVRYYNAEIHNVASIMGGVASQEAVKLITGQYVPIDCTYVYNGIVSVGGVYKV